MNHILRRIFYAIILIFSATGTSHAASGDLFPYPVPPDTLMALQPRCDFIVNRFWDRCNFETALLHPEKFNRAFGDWVSIMQHASADTAHMAIDKLLARFAKKGNETLTLATMAENWLYSDTSQIFSEEIYLPFARAAATNKKIDKASKARFALHTKVIESSGLGANLPDLEFERPDGSRGHIGEISRASVLIFINDPGCSDCNLARVRLSADYNANQLIERGELAIISLYPAEADDEWREAAASYPANWTVGALENADEYFDMRTSPLFVFLNAAHKVLAKNLDIDYLLGAFRVANTQNQR